MIIQVENLHKGYPQPEAGTLAVLSGAGFSLAGGETLAITGQSGSGKSTLIALLAGLDRPDDGRVVINGEDLTVMRDESLTRFRAGHIGIIFQQFHLLPHLTAEENVSLPLELLRLPGVRARTTAILEKVGLADRGKHLPGQLSGGECQRVAIARALVVEPALLLADEPTGNLDVATGRSIADLLFHLVEQEKMTMIVVTHNAELAGRCLRQLQLAEGVLQ